MHKLEALERVLGLAFSMYAARAGVQEAGPERRKDWDALTTVAGIAESFSQEPDTVAEDIADKENRSIPGHNLFWIIRREYLPNRSVVFFLEEGSYGREARNNLATFNSEAAALAQVSLERSRSSDKERYVWTVEEYRP